MVILNKAVLCFLLFYIIFSYPAHGRVVNYLKITETGTHDEGRKDQNEIEACKFFVPNKTQLVNFFNLAKESKEIGTLLHEYYSPCLSTGLIKFTDGSSGSWVLQSSGFGYVTFSNNETTYFFHKDNKWTDPYACTYGLGNDPIC
ncbi:hypothetical protein [Pseudomonas graminis]